MFDVLIIGGGVSGVSAALIFGSAKEKSFMADKQIGIIAHQKALLYKTPFLIMPTELHLEL